MEHMIKTIPVTSGRHWWISPANEYHSQSFVCNSPDTGVDDSIHVAEVTGSIQLSDIKLILAKLVMAHYIELTNYPEDERDDVETTFGLVAKDFQTKYSHLLEAQKE